jgi:hypothetical protein
VVLIGLATTCAFSKNLAVLKLFCHHGLHWLGTCLAIFQKIGQIFKNLLVTMVSIGLATILATFKKLGNFKNVLVIVFENCLGHFSKKMCNFLKSFGHPGF